MMSILRFLVKTIYIGTLFILIFAGISAFMLYTTPGLHLVIQLSRIYIPGSIKIQNLEGSLLNNFTAETVEYQNQGIHLKLKQVNVQWQPDLWLKNHVFTAQWQDLQGQLSNGQQVSSTHGTLTATATLPKLKLKLDSKVDIAPEKNWQLNATASAVLPWKWIVDANLIPSTNPSGLHTQFALHGYTESQNQGKFVLSIAPGYYQIPAPFSLPQVQFKGGTITIALTPKALTGNGNLSIDQYKNLKLNFALPQFALDTGVKADQRLESELRLEINSLAFLQNISPEIEKLQGQIVASIKVLGTLTKPQIISQLMMSKASLFLPKLKLNLDAIHLNIIGKEQRWNATGSIVSAGSTLSLKGTGALKSNYVGDISLEGADFPIINTNEYQIKISPKLKLHITPTTRDISGTILVPFAQIKPQTFTNSISLPDEVVYKNNKDQSAPFSLRSNANITLEAGKNVALNVKGLKGYLDGTITMKQQAQGTLNAYGELSIRKGTYKAYGQELTIRQGQLIFTGGPIDNPGINLRASKTINNTPTTFTGTTQLFDFNTSNLQNVNYGDHITVGVEVTGRLTKPQIQLFSDPAILSQADILSMLVLGRPASQANKAGGQLLLAAISSMNIGGANSNQLLEQLKQTSGLDFNVQTTTNYNQTTNTVSDTTAFVVGKSLSKRLYLSYNIGLSQTDTNMLVLKYILNRFFSIQVSSSDTSNAIDFLYTSNKKIKKSKAKTP